MARDFTEYEFDLPDGSKAYEIVDMTCNRPSPSAQVHAFMRLHDAKAARPLKD